MNKDFGITIANMNQLINIIYDKDTISKKKTLAQEFLNVTLFFRNSAYLSKPSQYMIRVKV
jgi:hypothetical protein